MSKAWLVTGSASGLGRDIAEAVLASGDRLVATARNPKQLADLVTRYGDKVRAVALDVTDAVAAREIVNPEDFKNGISKIIDGTVECLNASTWCKQPPAPSSQPSV